MGLGSGRSLSMDTDFELIEALKTIPSAACLDVLDSMGYTNTQMVGVFSLIKGQKLVGRAVTIRFVPSRPDLRSKVIGGINSAEYQAIELCNDNDVLIMATMRSGAPSAAGDIKLSRLAKRNAAGVVTDGGVRDLESLQKMGIGIFASQETNMTMPSHILPTDFQVNVQCVLVMPGDYITADDGGVVVIPKDLIGEVIEGARYHELLEASIKQQLEVEDVSPGKYYPFNEETKRLLK